MGQGPSNANVGYGQVRSSDDESTPPTRKPPGDPYWSGYHQQTNSITENGYVKIDIENAEREIKNIEQQITNLNKKLVDNKARLQTLENKLLEINKKGGGGGKTKLLKRKNKTIKKKI
jgi:predicted RNase H-like nuclease (RuvC/YqgF family)